MSDYLTTLFGLEGKVVALTGAGGYLIGEMARSLGRAGVKVAVLDANVENAERTAREITEAGGEAIALALDVRSKEAHAEVLAAILDRFGRLDGAVLGAGINAPTPFLDISVEEWNNILAVQLTGTMLGFQVFGGYLVEQKRGSIITISSASAGPPLSKAFTYSAAKAALSQAAVNSFLMISMCAM